MVQTPVQDTCLQDLNGNKEPTTLRRKSGSSGMRQPPSFFHLSILHPSSLVTHGPCQPVPLHLPPIAMRICYCTMLWTIFSSPGWKKIHNMALYSPLGAKSPPGRGGIKVLPHGWPDSIGFNAVDTYFNGVAGSLKSFQSINVAYQRVHCNVS